MSSLVKGEILVIDSPIQLEFVRVPAGEFLMGTDPGKDKFARPDEQPQHRVFVSEFYIGRYEVTYAQYGAYARANGIALDIPEGKDNHPVVKVSWREAVLFCEWVSQATGRSVRLPTEAEWEKAARGTDGRLYPWGNEWNPSGLNSSEGGAVDTADVDKFSPAGDSPYGAADMVGNVWEWTADWFNPYVYEERVKAGLAVKDPTGPAEGTHRTTRGGSWYFRQSGARAAYRFKYAPGFRCYDVGFRVATV
jgi:formylglycine-generating enzyme required for sulfatase activity